MARKKTALAFDNLRLQKFGRTNAVSKLEDRGVEFWNAEDANDDESNDGDHKSFTR